MRWKLSSLIIFGCCLASVLSARQQAGRSGISVIVVPTQIGAEELRVRIRSGVSFEALAMAYSVRSHSLASRLYGDRGRVRPETGVPRCTGGNQAGRRQPRGSRRQQFHAAEANDQPKRTGGDPSTTARLQPCRKAAIPTRRPNFLPPATRPKALERRMFVSRKVSTVSRKCIGISRNLPMRNPRPPIAGDSRARHRRKASRA